jgi:DNA-binding NarL/FixJ family response regulator
VAAAADGNSALDPIRRYKPDLVVLDLCMPALIGIEVSRELAKSSSSPLVVICSVETDPEIVEGARQAGALAYVFKLRVQKDFILAVKSALQGKPLCHEVRNELSTYILTSVSRRFSLIASPCRGTRTLISVPNLGFDRTEMVPFIRRTRSLMLIKPRPSPLVPSGSKPIPESRIKR